MKNLLIFTSRGIKEYLNFWDLTGSGIVFNGENFKTNGGGWDFDNIEEKICSEGYLVFLHQNMQTKTQKRTTGDKKYPYTVYYYTTQGDSFMNDLWSWDGSSKFECYNPRLPFDLLCCALRKNDKKKIENAKIEIFKWYAAKSETTKNSEQKLKYLSCCMSKETIEAYQENIDNTGIFPEEIRQKIKKQTDIMKEHEYTDPEYQSAFMEVCRVLDEIT